ncbi:lysM domain receptor-like kinase 3 [Cynara cardunculus var. scolymus]|uniref:lysM domain receptor-like kinase 3 n=1 Tax=Cynara cardunculus var. scolymus TaxID=59895 RepID=UPI000D62B9E4|nr:lysM domain receptor-like kinase 3 [Cynara cardunculus var. scolymus]
MLMASSSTLFLSISFFITQVFSLNLVIKSTLMYPLTCSNYNHTCDSYLYHISKGHKPEEIASFYSVNASRIMPMKHNSDIDYLVSVKCRCEQDDSGHGYYLYNSVYERKPGESVEYISDEYYSGQVWKFGGEDEEELTVRLVCGCIENEAQEVVTYTIQSKDTLIGISDLLSAKEAEVENLNKILTKDPNYMDVGWVLFVPREKNQIEASRSKSKRRRMKTWTLILSVVSALVLLMVAFLVLFLLRKRRAQRTKKDESKSFRKSLNAEKTTLENHFLNMDMEEAASNIESEKPVIISLEEIELATNSFDETRKIGEGGYGSVYFGIIRKRDAAIKKMRSNKSKEFFAELKVLCRIHHNNVVQLLGYASGDNHLYLVYEYVPNGTLSDHLQDPLLKGHQPLSWTARASIALDAARGIEYIHDHTKARYVHRDIKTSNILLDLGLKAKVADFGLTKFVERANEDDFVATRVVGTPGYLAPESISEMQTTSKTDVFAFGVVLAELITGQRALARDKQDPARLKTLVSVIRVIFQHQDSAEALEAQIDNNLKGSYPIEEINKMAETSFLCLSEDPANRPEMREVVSILAQIVMASIEWEASLGGTSQVFSGLFNGR